MTTKQSSPKEGDLQIWWIPQIGMGCPIFEVPVKSVEQAIPMLDMLANYDMFQYENNIKPDYSNMGGLYVYEDGEWCDWNSEDGDDIHQYMTNLEEDSEAA